MIFNGVRTGQAGLVFDARVSTWNSSTDGAQSGGDWSDAFAVSEDVVALTVGDVTGHGQAVTATMAAMRAAVFGAIPKHRVPSEMLSAVNEAACEFGDGVIVTAIVALLNRRRRTLSFANAGHPPPLMLTFGGHAFLQREPADHPLGIFPNHRLADYVVALPVDALLVLYTDGVTEHDRDALKGEAELVAAARSVHARTGINAARSIARRVFGTCRGTDDAAALAVRTLPAYRFPAAAAPGGWACVPQ